MKATKRNMYGVALATLAVLLVQKKGFKLPFVGSITGDKVQNNTGGQIYDSPDDYYIA